MSTVYFLGAGASKAIDSTLPLARELLPRIVAPWNRTDPDRLGTAREFVRQFCKQLPEPVSNLDYENLLGLVESALWAGKPLASYSPDNLSEVRKALLYCLWVILAQAETGVADGRVLERVAPLARLIWQCEDDPTVSVITTNYDLVVEYAASQYLRYWNPTEAPPLATCDYSVRIRCNLSLSNSRDGLDSSPYERDKVQLPYLKLHGSINWLYCSDCKEIDWMGIRPLAAAEAFTELWKCCKCGNRYEPIVVPPAVGKSPSYPVLKSVWSRAEEKLSEAGRIIFVGFSLSDGDAEIRNLLMLARANSHKLKEVILVDPSAGQLMSRYESIYGKLVGVYPSRDWKNYLDSGIPVRSRS